MQRYIETFIRRKWLFLVPALLIPVLTLGIAYLSGREYVVAASLWVQQPQLLGEESNSFGRRGPNVTEAQAIEDRLLTEDFREQMIIRSGLSDMILADQWPVPTRTQELMATNGLTRTVGRVLGLTAPQTQPQAFTYALRMIDSSIKVRPMGNNVIVVAYTGREPQLGQRLLEEVIKLDREERIAARMRETEVGVEYLTRQLESLEQRLSASTEKLLRFEEEYPAPPLGLPRPPEELEQLQQLRQAQQLDQTLYLDTVNKLQNLDIRSEASISVAGFHLQVIDPPVAGTASATISPRKLGMMGMLGVTIGLILSTVLLVVVTWRDGLIRTTADVRRAVGNVTVVEVPKVALANGRLNGVLKAVLGITGEQAGEH